MFLTSCTDVGGAGTWWREFKGEREEQVIEGRRRTPLLNPGGESQIFYGQPAKKVANTTTNASANSKTASPQSIPYDQYVAKQDAQYMAEHREEPGFFDRMENWMSRISMVKPVAGTAVSNQQVTGAAALLASVPTAYEYASDMVVDDTNQEADVPLSTQSRAPMRATDVPALTADEMVAQPPAPPPAIAPRSRLPAETLEDIPTHARVMLADDPAYVSVRRMPVSPAMMNAPSSPPPVASVPRPDKPVSAHRTVALLDQPQAMMAEPAKVAPAVAASPMAASHSQIGLVDEHGYPPLSSVPATPERLKLVQTQRSQDEAMLLGEHEAALQRKQQLEAEIRADQSNSLLAEMHDGASMFDTLPPASFVVPSMSSEQLSDVPLPWAVGESRVIDEAPVAVAEMPVAEVIAAPAVVSPAPIAIPAVRVKRVGEVSTVAPVIDYPVMPVAVEPAPRAAEPAEELIAESGETPVTESSIVTSMPEELPLPVAYTPLAPMDTPPPSSPVELIYGGSPPHTGQLAEEMADADEAAEIMMPLSAVAAPDVASTDMPPEEAIARDMPEYNVQVRVPQRQLIPESYYSVRKRTLDRQRAAY